MHSEESLVQMNVASTANNHHALSLYTREERQWNHLPLILTQLFEEFLKQHFHENKFSLHLYRSIELVEKLSLILVRYFLHTIQT